ncbi:hypothetical protein SARC_17758, partial [Sphaeroforma arctica JP610]
RHLWPLGWCLCCLCSSCHSCPLTTQRRVNDCSMCCWRLRLGVSWEMCSYICCHTPCFRIR